MDDASRAVRGAGIRRVHPASRWVSPAVCLALVVGFFAVPPPPAAAAVAPPPAADRPAAAAAPSAHAGPLLAGGSGAVVLREPVTVPVGVLSPADARARIVALQKANAQPVTTRKRAAASAAAGRSGCSSTGRRPRRWSGSRSPARPAPR